MHIWRERVWASSLMRRSAVNMQLNHLCRSVLPGLCLPSGNRLVFSPLANLFQDPLPRCACTSQPRWISMQRHLGEARFIVAWHCPLAFDPQGDFLRTPSVSLAPRWGRREAEIP